VGKDESEKKEEEAPPRPRRIGPLTLEERRAKIDRYKRKKRSFNKKVSYTCRKRVADQRMRVKGRFVKREEVLLMLGLPGGCDIPESELKARLGQKLRPKPDSLKLFEHKGLEKEEEELLDAH
jgi:hypothetical protein